MAPGLARIQAKLANPVELHKQIETTFMEIAVFNDLKTMNPSYDYFFADLVSKVSSSSGPKNFNEHWAPKIFDLAFNSKLAWQLQGGTNYWKDANEKYNTIHKLVALSEKAEDKVLEIREDSEEQGFFIYRVSCGMPYYGKNAQHKFEVQTEQSNQATRLLLRPVTHKHSVQFHCEPPATSQLHWAQKLSSPDPAQLAKLPKQRVSNSEKLFFVLVNSENFVRTLLLDRDHQALFNHSSVLTEVTSSNTTLLQVYDKAEETTVLGYDKRFTRTFSDIGTLYLRAKSSAYFDYKGSSGGYFAAGSATTVPLGRSSYGSDFVEDVMKVQVVRNVEVWPKYKSVYIPKNRQTSFTFKIREGSGFYQVKTNDTEIAELTLKESEIIITPKHEGGLRITVEDIEVPESKFAVAELLISDIHRLKLEANATLMEQGSQIVMNLTAFDRRMEEFDPEQYELMIFDIEIEKTGV